MRTFLVLICSLALACAAVGAQKDDKSKKSGPKRKQAQSAQHAAAPGGGAQKTKGSQQLAAHHGRPTTAGKPTSMMGEYIPKAKVKTKRPQQAATAAGAQKTKHFNGVVTRFSAGSTPSSRSHDQKANGSQQIATQSAQAAHGHGLGVDHTLVNKHSYVAKYKAKHFNLQTTVRRTTIRGVTFQQKRRIVGSQNWVGPNYTVFRTYTPVWHERNWWNSHYNRVVFVFGGWYYWNAGWWYPAWGYAPNAYYAYDGPIYAYNDLRPDQVIANVQAALQEQGYYQGDVDGLLGPLTRDALANYQRDHGLYETAAIDRPTLESLGMA